MNNFEKYINRSVWAKREEARRRRTLFWARLWDAIGVLCIFFLGIVLLWAPEFF